MGRVAAKPHQIGSRYVGRPSTVKVIQKTFLCIE